MRELILKNDIVVLLDDSDYEWAIEQPTLWYSKRQLKSGGMYYQIGNKNGLLSRQLLGVTDPKIKVDHINHNGLDNRRENLRLCTHQQNNLNKRKFSNTSSIYKGVYWHKRDQKWVVGCQVNGKPKNLGCFESELAAALAYDNFVKTLPDAEFRVLNFPDKT